VNCDNPLVVTITVICYSWAPSSGDRLFSCSAISATLPSNGIDATEICPCFYLRIVATDSCYCRN